MGYNQTCKGGGVAKLFSLFKEKGPRLKCGEWIKVEKDLEGRSLVLRMFPKLGYEMVRAELGRLLWGWRKAEKFGRAKEENGQDLVTAVIDRWPVVLVMGVEAKESRMRTLRSLAWELADPN